MKIEFGNMTVKQAKELCENTEKCGDCPIQEYCPRTFNIDPCNFHKYEMEAEIELPDEGDKKGEICPYPNCHYKNDHDRCIGCDSRYKETDKFDSIINDLKNVVQPKIDTDSKLPEGCREVH